LRKLALPKKKKERKKLRIDANSGNENAATAPHPACITREIGSLNNIYARDYGVFEMVTSK